MTRTHRLLAMDGNWHVHRAFYALGGARPGADVNKAVAMTAAKVLQWCLSYVSKHEATHLIFALDGGKSFRKSVYPAYKSRRGHYMFEGRKLHGEEVTQLILEGAALTRLPDPVDLAIQETHDQLSDWGFCVLKLSGYEADDVLASAAKLTRRFAESGERLSCVLSTSDKDTVQSLNKYTIQQYPNHVKGQPDIVISHNVLGDRLVKYVQHEDARSWSPNTFLDFQILIGDPTDDIPALLTKAVARKILVEHGSLHAYFKTKIGRKFFEKHRIELARNVRLVRMQRDLLDSWDVPTLHDEAAVRAKPPKGYVMGNMVRSSYSQYLAWQAQYRTSSLL